VVNAPLVALPVDLRDYFAAQLDADGNAPEWALIVTSRSDELVP
jgi:hypothetical protein